MQLKLAACYTIDFVFLCTEVKFCILVYSDMHPLLRKTLVRLSIYQIYCLFVAWIFTLIEKRDEPAYKRMERMLNELKTEVDLQYNMTDKYFQSFVRRAAAAVSEGEELDWTYLNSLGFIFAAVTTIGKFYNVY